MSKRIVVITALMAMLLHSVALAPANAVTLVATGTNPSVCNQIVSNSSGITAQRSSQECIVTFTNTTEASWTVPAGVTRISAIIVGGGGGGGDSKADSTGGGGGSGGFFQNSNIAVAGSIAIAVGAGGSGSSQTTQGGNGGTSYIGTLKVGGGGGGNGVIYQGGARARAGVGGADFVSSGSGGGGRPTGTAAFTNEYLGGLAGDYAISGVDFLGITYSGLQGSAGNRNGDGASGGMGGVVSPSSNRTSSISGSSVEYSKISGYRAWEDGASTAGTKTPGSGGSPNYSYGTDPYGSGGSGANGIVIIRYTIVTTISSPTFSGVINKGATESMTVTMTIPGRVRFYIGNKRIPQCLAVPTTGTAPELTATCTWKPAVQGMQSVYAVLTPTEGTFSQATSDKSLINVLKRSNNR
jgi:hypothetical protein